MWDSVWSLSPIVQFSCCSSASQMCSGVTVACVTVTADKWQLTMLSTASVLNISVIIWCLHCAIYCHSKCKFINIWILFQAYFQNIVEVFSVLQDFLYCLIKLISNYFFPLLQEKDSSFHSTLLDKSYYIPKGFFLIFKVPWNVVVWYDLVEINFLGNYET